MTVPYLKKQRSHSFPTLYLSPHRCGRNKAEWNLSKYCLLNLPFHFSAGCCCWFTSAVQTGRSSGQSLLTALFPPPLVLCHQSLYCLTETNNQSPSSSFTSYLVPFRAVLWRPTGRYILMSPGQRVDERTCRNCSRTDISVSIQGFYFWFYIRSKSDQGLARSSQ